MEELVAPTVHNLALQLFRPSEIQLQTKNYAKSSLSKQNRYSIQNLQLIELKVLVVI